MTRTSLITNTIGALTALATATATATAPAHAQSVNVSFTSTGTAPATAYEAEGCPGTWNAVNSVSANLNGLNGSLTGISVSSASWNNFEDFTTTGTDEDLLYGTMAWTFGLDYAVNISGLTPGDYKLYLYASTGRSDALFSTGDITVPQATTPTVPQFGPGLEHMALDVTVASDGLLDINAVYVDNFFGLAGFQLDFEAACDIVQFDGFTRVDNADGTTSVSWDEDPRYSVDFPVGSVFDADAGIAVTPNEAPGVVRVAVSGVSMAGGTKTIRFPVVVGEARVTQSRFGEVYRASISSGGCPFDEPEAVALAPFGGCFHGSEIFHSYRFTRNYGQSDVLASGHTQRDRRPDGESPFTVTSGPLSVTYSDFETFTHNEDFEYTHPTNITAALSGLTHSTLFIYADSDSDGLADYDETNVYGTDTELADTDGDGVADADEVALGTDPVDETSFADADADGDGVFAADEVMFGTDPDLADTDGDGVWDGEELQDNTDPNDPADHSLQDADGDSIDDRHDNCADVANPDQADADDDGVGSACDDDESGDNPDTASPDTAPPDTDLDDDTDLDLDTDLDTGGCGCTAMPGPPGGVVLWFALLALITSRRRTRSRIRFRG